MALKTLWAGGSQVRDLTPLKEMPLTELIIPGTQVQDLSPLKGMPLTSLGISGTQVRDLSPLAGMKLIYLECEGTSVSDLSPLRGMDLQRIRLTPKNITQGLNFLRDMKSLKTIGIGGPKDLPAAEFWQRYDKGEFGKAFTDADVQRIAALPAKEQVEEVRKELIRRNPGFDGKMETKIEGGVVTEFKIVTDQVTDIAPIRVFNALRVLECGGTHIGKRNGLLADLTPLKGMNLAGLTDLDLTNTKVTDAEMVCFKDCKALTKLYLQNMEVSDAGLAHFKDCKNLTKLHLQNTKVSDAGLAHLKGWIGGGLLSGVWIRSARYF
jgi:Leucine-rich repeat (LRR) protein